MPTRGYPTMQTFGGECKRCVNEVFSDPIFKSQDRTTFYVAQSLVSPTICKTAPMPEEYMQDLRIANHGAAARAVMWGRK